jgi:Cu2+-exporting ATPase
LSLLTKPNSANPAEFEHGRVKTGHCPHCGTEVEGHEDAYCCGGCEMAAGLIRDAGLERYYAEREDFAPRSQSLDDGWDTVPVEADSAGIASVGLMIDGLRCASCVWVTEHLLQNTPGVVDATVSYATGRCTVRWEPARLRLSDLAGRIATLGYRPRLLGEEARVDHDLLLRLGVAVFAAANIMMMSAALYAGWWSSMDPRFVVLFQWASLTLATPVALWCAAPFFSGAWAGLKNHVLHMDLPIALGITVLYVQGVVATMRSEHAYVDSLAMLVALLLAGRMLESSGRRRAAEAAVSLASSAPPSARRSTGDGIDVVPADQLCPGDLIDVGAGEEVAADGTVVTGQGKVRMAVITGESEPVEVGSGSDVVAGSVLMDGAVTVEVVAVGRDTILQQMAERLRLATDRGTRPTSADRIAPWFTAGTLTVAAATFTAWVLMANFGAAVTRAVAVLVVACPCALALSRPLAAAAGLGASARRGLLFRSADALLDLIGVDLVVLDKTGTVTKGSLAVVAAEDEAIRIAAGLERYSSHPIARAIVDEARKRGIPLPRGSEVVEVPGVGISGTVAGRSWRLRAGGPGQVLLSNGDGDCFVIALGDAVRFDSAKVIRRIKQMELDVALLTGDHRQVADRIGKEIGVETVVPRIDPVGKAEWIRARQDRGSVVLFAGDGINDGPALAEADVGVAMGTGAASSVLVADGVISSSSLAPIPAAFRAAQACSRAIRLNQIRSIAYNVIAVSAAAAGLVNPLVAAVLMPLSSAMVIWGASRVETVVRRSE